MLNDKAYLDSLNYVLTHGKPSKDRTGTGTLRVTGLQARYDLRAGFPLLTTKKVLYPTMLIELLWFLQGRNDLQWLQDRKCPIWNSWHDDANTIGPGYGVQWRKWPKGAIHKVDQIKEVIKSLKENPDSRRHIVNAWNVGELERMALPPCHYSFQFNVIDGVLDCILTQRSGDMFLGVPFNIASYATLMHLLAKECNLKVGELVHNIGDAHIYENHIEQVKLQLSREPMAPPSLVIDDSIYEHDLLYWIDNKCKELSLDDINKLIYVKDYKSHAFIKAPVAV